MTKIRKPKQVKVGDHVYPFFEEDQPAITGLIVQEFTYADENDTFPAFVELEWYHHDNQIPETAQWRATLYVDTNDRTGYFQIVRGENAPTAGKAITSLNKELKRITRIVHTLEQ